jgi:hypothetical protein
MAMFVGLDVSLKTTSICVVEADGTPVWEGKVESEPAALIKVLMLARTDHACRYRTLPLKLEKLRQRSLPEGRRRVGGSGRGRMRRE